MKVSSTDYEQLLKAAKTIKDKCPDITPGLYKKNKIGKDTNRRFRWDMYWSIVKVLPLTTLNNIRELKDNHIDTALKKIVKELYG